MSWKPAKEPSRFPDWIPGWLRGLLRWCLKWGLVAFTLLMAIGLFYFYLSWKYDLRIVSQMPERSVILDRTGKEFATIHGERRRLITREEIPEAMVHALLAREDARFFNHHGVDVKGLARATLRNIKDRSFTQGASTLTMQLTRNSYDMRAKSIHRKLLEMAVTVRIEHRYTKDEILTHYLNRIYFGSGCHGVEEAAQTYFGRSTKDLNLGECALLVGIIRGPHLFSPFRNLEGALTQRDEVLARMVEVGYLTEEQAGPAKTIPVRLVPEAERNRASSYARESIRRQLNVILDRHDIRGGGLQIHTSLDAGMQRQMERALVSRVLGLEGAPDSGLQAAMVRVDPATGGIMALCGGRDYATSPYNRVRQARRDLGPMFVPFMQAIALERSKVVVPGSIVQTGRQLGVDESIRLSKRLGFSGPFADNEDLYRGIIGSSPMELAGAASALVTGGERYEGHLIVKITDADGRVLFRSDPAASHALSAAVAADARAMMVLQDEMMVASTGSRHDGWGLSFKGGWVTVLWLGYDQPRVLGDRGSIQRALRATLQSVDTN